MSGTCDSTNYAPCPPCPPPWMNPADFWDFAQNFSVLLINLTVSWCNIEILASKSNVAAMTTSATLDITSNFTSTTNSAQANTTSTVDFQTPFFTSFTSSSTRTTTYKSITTTRNVQTEDGDDTVSAGVWVGVAIGSVIVCAAAGSIIYYR